MANNKQFGLIMPKAKAQLSAPKAGNVFGNNDDSDEEGGTDWVKKSLQAAYAKNKVKRQTQLDIKKALEEDSTIFQYDEVYNEMEKAKEEQKLEKKEKARPVKYINNLLKTAELRKKEQELRKERLIQAEVRAEEAMFPDKERYITSSYKAKLEEMKTFQEEQDNQDRLEAIGDVTKQKDMSGFYRHLYRQTVDKNDADLGIVPEKSDQVENKNEKDRFKSSSQNTNKKRQYRQRAEEASESESEPEVINKEVEDKKIVDKENLKEVDKESEPLEKKQKLSNKMEDERSEESSTEVTNPKSQIAEKVAAASKAIKEVEEKTEAKPKPVKKKKVNIWEKKTVGLVFEAALQRYLERKAARLTNLQS